MCMGGVKGIGVCVGGRRDDKGIDVWGGLKE